MWMPMITLDIYLDFILKSNLCMFHLIKQARDTFEIDIILVYPVHLKVQIDFYSGDVTCCELMVQIGIVSLGLVVIFTWCELQVQNKTIAHLNHGITSKRDRKDFNHFDVKISTIFSNYHNKVPQLLLQVKCLTNKVKYL